MAQGARAVDGGGSGRHAAGAGATGGATGTTARPRLKSFCLYAAAFLIPATIIAGVMAVLGITPFGDTSVFLWDALLQHKDYLGWIWDLLHGQASIEYSSGKSLGGRMLGLIGFYGSSPLNLLLIFFKKSQIPLFMSLVIILRIGLCGLTSQIFLQKRIGLRAMPALLFSTAYALMDYNLYYCRNCMWLDGVIMLPLVALGVYQVVHEKKPGLLCASVALAIISNWYTGYMVCLFSIFYCLFEYCLFTEMHPLKRFHSSWKSIARYAAAMVVGVLISCVVLLPALLSLVNGKATNNRAGLSHAVHFDLLHFFSGFELVAGAGNQDEPVVFCGGLLLLSSFYYFCCAKIGKRERVLSGVFVLFLIASFCLQDLELLWTAYVKSDSYHFRFAFVVPFFMLVLSGRTWKSIEEEGVQKKGVALAAGLVLAVFAALFLRGDLRSTGLEFGLYALFLVLLAVAMALFQDRRRWLRTGVAVLLAAMVTVELCANAWYAFRGYKEYDYSSSEFGEYVEEMEEVIAELDELSDGSFYRFERDDNYLTLVGRDVASSESLLFGYNSIEHYSSAYDWNVDSFLAAVGYSDGVDGTSLKTETYWNSSMLLTDSLLSVRYAVLDEVTFGYEDAGAESELPFEGSGIYENAYALPLGYKVSSDMGEVDWDENPYENQEALLSAMLGKEAEVYREVELVSDELVDGEELLTLRACGDGPVYLYLEDETIESLFYDNCEIYVDGEYLQECCTRFQINSMLLGDYEEGEEIQVLIRRVDGADETSTHGFYAAQLDEEAFEEAMSELSEGYESELNVEGKVLSGTYTCKEDSTVFLSIPYEESWTLYVDGQEAEFRELAGTFIGIDLEAGEHEIRMVYSTPGLDEGAALSVLGLVLFVAYGVAVHRQHVRGRDEHDAGPSRGAHAA